MTESIFSILNTYKPTESVTPEENYSPELLVYLLNYSLMNETPLFINFMKLLRENIEIADYKDFKISTQEIFYSANNIKAIPDITIKTERQYYFIEVKVESDLNYYPTGNADDSASFINQIQKYQDINCSRSKHVYLLTKYINDEQFSDCSDFQRKIKWFEIHQLLKDYHSENSIENYLVPEMIKFMEDKGMAIQKVSYELMEGMKSLKNLLMQIETALEGIQYHQSTGLQYLGYLLGNKDAWVGTYYEGNRLRFEHYHQKVVEFIKENKLPNYDFKNYYHYTYFDFEKYHYFCLTPEEQVDLLRKWIQENYQLIAPHLK